MRRPPDDCAADDFEAMMLSAPWRAYVARLDEVVEAKRTELERLAPQAETDFTRGFIAGVRRVLLIPEALSEELKRSER